MTESIIDVVVRPAGKVQYLYNEEVDLSLLGKGKRPRASFVEPTEELTGDAVDWLMANEIVIPDEAWWADLGVSGGPVLGPFISRSAALEAERHWLLANVLLKGQRNA